MVPTKTKMNKFFGFKFGFESFPSNLEYSDSKILETKWYSNIWIFNFESEYKTWSKHVLNRGFFWKNTSFTHHPPNIIRIIFGGWWGLSLELTNERMFLRQWSSCPGPRFPFPVYVRFIHHQNPLSANGHVGLARGPVGEAPRRAVKPSQGSMRVIRASDPCICLIG